MTPLAGDPESGDPLEPVLRDAEDELHHRLREACEAEARGISNQSSAEIRRLEDALLAAAASAQQTLALRRRLDLRRSEAPPVPDAGESPSQGSLGVREFRDVNGQRWRAWPVRPGQARAGRAAQQYLGEFLNGWICFEALEGSARRRLPQQQPRWSELEDSELAALLEQAISAPERKPRPGAGGNPDRLS